MKFYLMNAYKAKIVILMSILVSLFFLNGCSTSQNLAKKNLTESQKKSLWQNRQNQLLAFKEISLNGSLYYYSEKQKEYGRFSLTFKDKKNYLFKITSPIGTTVLSLSVSPEEAILKDRKGNLHQGSNPTQLIQELTKFTLPFDSLEDWLLGISASYQVQNINDNGAVYKGEIISNPNNWHWQVDDWQFDSDLNLELPKQIDLSSEDTQIQIKIWRWILK